jgi:hypothetical protein
MSNQSSVVVDSNVYRERAAERGSEFEQLAGELLRLRRAQPRDLERIKVIRDRLQRLADDQRTENAPHFDQKHQVSLWRRWDLQARIADNLVNAGGRNLEALDAEYESVVQRGFSGVTAADIALMQLTGEPLIPFNYPEPEPDNSWGIGLMISIGVIALTGALRNAGLGVVGAILSITWILFYISTWFVPELGQRVGLSRPDPPALVPEFERKCAGYKAYRELVIEGIGAVNANIAATAAPPVTPWDLRRAKSDTEVFQGKLRRLAVPPVAISAHGVLIDWLDGWIGIFRSALDGSFEPDDLDPVDEISNRFNEQMNRLDGTCFAA